MASKKHVFTQIEKKVFLNVLKAYSTIVENKNTDGSTLRDKNVAWDNITVEYNASPHVTAEVSNKQLRRLWMNLKQRQRGAMTKERQHRMATGGGPSTSDAVIDPDVAQIAPALMIEIPGAIDSDIVYSASSMNMDTSQAELNLNTQQSYTTDITLPPPPSITQPSPTTTSITLPTISTPPPPTITTPPPPTITTPPPPLNTIPVPHSSGTTPPYPSAASTPPLSIRTIPPPPQSSFSTTTTSFQRHKNTILEREYTDRFNRAGEIHSMEKELLAYKIREAKAKAELAELILQRERQQDT